MTIEVTNKRYLLNAEIHLREQMVRFDVPEESHDSLVQWILRARPVGHFLQAVLSNDLKEAIARADENNQHFLPQYVKFLYNVAPIGCWGSSENFENWTGLGKE